MSHIFVSTSSTPRHGGLPRLAGLAGADAAAVGVWLVARYGVGVQLRTPGFTSMQYSASLTVGFVLVASTVASLAGWGVVTLIERVTRRPRRAWITTGVLLTVVSLSAPLSGHGITATERLALVCMHLAVAAVLIPVFALTIRPSQRPVEDAPGNSDADRRPISPAEARR
jgi:Family of unknown function (DUF6069)